MPEISTAGDYRLGDRNVRRMGYGAMQLAGQGVFGPPRDPAEAVAVLREAVAAGVNHIDTSGFYGPRVTNQVIAEALHPYPSDLVIVTKVGARRGDDASWLPATAPDELIAQVRENLVDLKAEALDVVNLRLPGHAGPTEGPVAAMLEPLAALQRQGLIRHLGLSNATSAQVREAQGLAEIVCVQNFYNLANRGDDPLVDELAAAGIAYVPFFPLGGFFPLQSEALSAAAAKVGATPLQVAQAWLLQRSPNMLLIPGTSSRAHLRENLAAASLALPAGVVAELNAIGGGRVNAPAHG